MNAGDIVEGHTHNFHHTTFFPSGVWKCERFGRIVGTDDGWHKVSETTIRGGSPGAWLPIEADMKHRFELLEGPGCYMCVYAHRVPETGEVVKEFNAWRDAYV